MKFLLNSLVIKINSKIRISLIKYITARIDIKNLGGINNKIEFLLNSDDESDITFPDWYKDDFGEGVVIQSHQCVLDLKLKCVGDGKLNIALRGVDVKNRHKQRMPIFIKYTNLNINGNQILDEYKLCSHDDFFQHDEHDVKNGDIFFIHIEWESL